MSRAYYNEYDPYASAWLRNLAAAGHIAPGVIDDRSILDVRPDDLAECEQAHFFAGVGVWSHALRAIGVPDDWNIWTGSCPCQPFSVAGRGRGEADERHLWPDWFKLIAERRPALVFGEQVASPAGLNWFDAVSADLEGAGYAVAAADLCAAGIGAPHIRQRLYFVAYSHDPRPQGRALHASSALERAFREGRLARGLADAVSAGRTERGTGAGERQATGRGGSGRVADADGERRDGVDALLWPAEAGRLEDRVPEATGRGGSGRVGDADSDNAGRDAGTAPGAEAESSGARGTYRDGRGHNTAASGAACAVRGAGPTHGFWGAADWIRCVDGKWRPVEPGTFPLAHGAAARVGRLRAYGNAIVSPLAQAFARGSFEALGIELPATRT